MGFLGNINTGDLTVNQVKAMKDSNFYNPKGPVVTGSVDADDSNERGGSFLSLSLINI